MSNFTSPFRPLCSVLLAAALAVTALAQQSKTRDYSWADSSQEMLPKYKAALDAKKYDEAIALLDAQIAKVPADSYDAAMLNQIKVQTLFQKGDFPKAIEPMERALALSEAKDPTYFEDRVTKDLLYFLTQLYLQDAVTKKDPATAGPLFEKADKAMQRWLKLTPNSTPDAQLIYAQLLYSWASINPEKVNLDLIKRALDQVNIGLHLSTRPKDTFYLLKFVSLQQLNRAEEATEMLELMVKQKPDSSTYWQQLAGLYLGSGKDLRAALTIERAQANGLLNSPQYNFNLIGIYFNIAQYEKAADLLETGLKAGTVPAEQKNYELLSLCYQQMQQPLKGVEALKLASKAFPKSGQVEFLIAQAYYGLEKQEDALKHLEAAVAKGELTKPHQVYSFLAYVAYELKKFDVALEAAKKAVATPEGAKDAPTQNLLKGIEDIIKDREAKKAKM